MAAMTKPNISLTIDAHQADEREVFRPHGRLCVRLDGAVVRIDAEGPFNAELFEAFGRLGPGGRRHLPRSLGERRRAVSDPAFRNGPQGP